MYELQLPVIEQILELCELLIKELENDKNEMELYLKGIPFIAYYRRCEISIEQVQQLKKLLLDLYRDMTSAV